MHNLESWDRVYRGSRFDNLEELIISDCTKLTALPLSKLKSLKYLEIKNCEELRIDESDIDKGAVFRNWRSTTVASPLANTQRKI